MSRVSDTYTYEEFAELLDLAGENVKSSWESDFVAGLRSRFDEYGEETFLSEKQDQILNKIADR